MRSSNEYMESSAMEEKEDSIEFNSDVYKMETISSAQRNRAESDYLKAKASNEKEEAALKKVASTFLGMVMLIAIPGIFIPLSIKMWDWVF